MNHHQMYNQQVVPAAGFHFTPGNPRCTVSFHKDGLLPWAVFSRRGSCKGQLRAASPCSRSTSIRPVARKVVLMHRASGRPQCLLLCPPQSGLWVVLLECGRVLYDNPEVGVGEEASSLDKASFLFIFSLRIFHHLLSGAYRHGVLSN